MHRHLVDVLPDGGVIEFCGLPGAGKTTLSHEIAEQTDFTSVSAPVPLRLWPARVWKNLRMRCSNGVAPVLMTLLSLWLTPRGGSFRARLRRGWLLLRRVLARDSWEGTRVLYDQDLVQALSAFLMYCRSIPDEVVDDLLEVLYSGHYPAAVVHVDVEVTAALGGLRARAAEEGNRTDLDHLTDEQARAALKQQRSLLLRLTGRLGYRTQVVVTDRSGNVRQLVQEKSERR